jgi:hypothetical protein
MKVSIRKTEELRIEDEASTESINVTLVDESPGVGRLVVQGTGQTSACYWNNMGKLSTREFFLAATDKYIVGCLDPFGTLFRKIEPKTLSSIVIADIEKADTTDGEQKLRLIARTREFDPISDVNGLHALNSDLMLAIYGPMWTNQVNERFLGQHPLYTGLFTRIATIRQVLLG